ncbi:hypothetical protein UMZ34_08545 [Halopseudomonas pachastrellae]|nr:hypothetical protein UMZ34_08545 [Halopseudomonas pachastrellae]
MSLDTLLLNPWLWLGLFILLAYTIEAITGFGSIVIALSLGACCCRFRPCCRCWCRSTSA